MLLYLSPESAREEKSDNLKPFIKQDSFVQLSLLQVLRNEEILLKQEFIEGFVYTAFGVLIVNYAALMILSKSSSQIFWKCILISQLLFALWQGIKSINTYQKLRKTRLETKKF